MTRILKAGAIATTLFAAVPSASACMNEAADSEMATGRLSIGTAQDAAGRPERPYILTLPTSACLTAADPESSVTSTRRIHVFPSTPKVHAAMNGLVGRDVRVRGPAFSAHTAHHHAPIVMEVTAIENP